LNRPNGLDVPFQQTVYHIYKDWEGFGNIHLYCCFSLSGSAVGTSIMSTTSANFLSLLLYPPAKKTLLPTDVATGPERGSLRRAVNQVCLLAQDRSTTQESSKRLTEPPPNTTKSPTAAAASP
jgi:hypothetical protein